MEPEPLAGHRDIGLQTLKQLLRRGSTVSLSEK
jgi:hypothetical protein